MRLILILLATLLTTACSMDRMLVKSSVPLIESGVEALNHETDLDLAEDSIPSNLNMLLGMIKIDPENAQLHTFAAQAFYGLAYGFNEDSRPERASDFYLRGMKHGITALESAAHFQDPCRQQALAIRQRRRGAGVDDHLAVGFQGAGDPLLANAGRRAPGHEPAAGGARLDGPQRM